MLSGSTAWVSPGVFVGGWVCATLGAVFELIRARQTKDRTLRVFGTGLLLAGISWGGLPCAVFGHMPVIFICSGLATLGAAIAFFGFLLLQRRARLSKIGA